MQKSSYTPKKKALASKSKAISKYPRYSIPRPRMNPMMGNSSAYTDQVWTQSYNIAQNAVSNNQYVYFCVDLLSNSSSGSTQIYNMQNV